MHSVVNIFLVLSLTHSLSLSLSLSLSYSLSLPPPLQVNLWIGRKGLITHTHYDCTYNFFVQLRGRKKFTLFPPNHTLYLYPCLHPVNIFHSPFHILHNSNLRSLFQCSTTGTVKLIFWNRIVIFFHTTRGNKLEGIIMGQLN